MSVAEKPTVETPQRSQHQQLLLSSSLAALYVIASFGLVFMGLPLLWRVLDLSDLFNEFLADALLILVTLPAIFGLFVLGRHLEGANPPRGQRAGMSYICLALVVAGLMVFSGSNLWSFIGIAVLVGAAVLFFQPAFTAWLVHCEDAGWFHATTYKPSQGLRVRRATVMGIMVLVICGIITLINRGSLKTGEYQILRPLFGDNSAAATDPWIATLPFSDTNFVLLFRISLTIPILLMVLAGWAAWRVVNWPAFADFLIATEAEMNKVSWTTRKRLYQDTIVVLVTVFLFTIFLFVVDILWIKILTNPVIDVLKHDPAEAARKNQQGAQW
jgi:preprotein translocase SecE subunit